jgi:hypothetical protein
VAGLVRFTRMGGSSIASPRAAGWVTDFLNAAYHARPAGTRDVDDLRLAACILATRWQRSGARRLGALDLPAFIRAFGRARMRGRMLLDRPGLLAGAARLHGDWFPDAYADARRRAYGIAFRSTSERAAFQPELRLRRAALGALTPHRAPHPDRHVGTYPPVALPDPAAALELVLDPPRWPDMGCAGGRFTPLRSGGLLGQTFEIEVVAEPIPRGLLHTRGYVTCTALSTRGGPGEERLAERVAETERLLSARGLAPALPPAATPLAYVELTTHAGHFLGPGVSRLIAFEQPGAGAFIRDVGSWDPLPAHLSMAFERAGREAQAAFWGPEDPERSMLAQLALVTAKGASP